MLCLTMDKVELQNMRVLSTEPVIFSPPSTAEPNPDRLSVSNRFSVTLPLRIDSSRETDLDLDVDVAGDDDDKKQHSNGADRKVASSSGGTLYELQCEFRLFCHHQIEWTTDARLEAQQQSPGQPRELAPSLDDRKPTDGKQHPGEQSSVHTHATASAGASAAARAMPPKVFAVLHFADDWTYDCPTWHCITDEDDDDAERCRRLSIRVFIPHAEAQKDRHLAHVRLTLGFALDRADLAVAHSYRLQVVPQQSQIPQVPQQSQIPQAATVSGEGSLRSLSTKSAVLSAANVRSQWFTLRPVQPTHETLYEQLKLFRPPTGAHAVSVFARLHDMQHGASADDLPSQKPHAAFTTAISWCERYAIYVMSDAETIGDWLSLRKALSQLHVPAQRLHQTTRTAWRLEKYCCLHRDGNGNGNGNSNSNSIDIGQDHGHGAADDASVRGMRQRIDGWLEEQSPVRLAALVMAQCLEFTATVNGGDGDGEPNIDTAAFSTATAFSSSNQSQSQSQLQPTTLLRSDGNSDSKDNDDVDGKGGFLCFLHDSARLHHAFERHVYECAKHLPSSSQCHVIVWGVGHTIHWDSALTVGTASAPVYPAASVPNAQAHVAFSLSLKACRIFQQALQRQLMNVLPGSLPSAPSPSPPSTSSFRDTIARSMLHGALTETIRQLEDNVYVCNPYLFQTAVAEHTINLTHRASLSAPSPSLPSSASSQAQTQAPSGAKQLTLVRADSDRPNRSDRHRDRQYDSVPLLAQPQPHPGYGHRAYRRLVLPSMDVVDTDRDKDHGISVLLCTRSDRFNQDDGERLLQTIRSIWMQTYGNIEMVVCACEATNTNINGSTNANTNANANATTLKHPIAPGRTGTGAGVGPGSRPQGSGSPSGEQQARIVHTLQSYADTIRPRTWLWTTAPRTSAAIARGLQQATGRFVLLVDADADDGVSSPERLACQIAVMLCTQYAIVSCERGFRDSSSARFAQPVVQRVTLQQHQYELCMYRRQELLKCRVDWEHLFTLDGNELSWSRLMFAMFVAVAKLHGTTATSLERERTASYARLPFYHCVPRKLLVY